MGRITSKGASMTGAASSLGVPSTASSRRQSNPIPNLSSEPPTQNACSPKRGKQTLESVGGGYEPREFSTWAPLVLCGIGERCVIAR